MYLILPPSSTLYFTVYYMQANDLPATQCDLRGDECRADSVHYEHAQPLQRRRALLDIYSLPVGMLCTAGMGVYVYSTGTSTTAVFIS